MYISVPFCKAKCTYCNFASGVFGAEKMDRYVERVCAEIRGVQGSGGGDGGFAAAYCGYDFSRRRYAEPVECGADAAAVWRAAGGV